MISQGSGTGKRRRSVGAAAGKIFRNSLAPPVFHRLMRPLLLFLGLLPLSLSASVERDLAYGDHPLQTYDLHLPAEAAKAPVMVYVHGGGWRRGDKAAVGLKPDWFNGKGWIFASLNYRLIPDGQHPANVNDVASAIARIHDTIAAKGGDPEKIFVMGHSAGAHLACLVATNPKPLESAGKPLSVLKGVISLDTNAYNLPALMESNARPFYETVFGNDPGALRDASPQHHLVSGSGVPPLLIAYSGGMGKKPDPMRRAAATRFRDASERAGIPTVLIDASDRNHGEINQWFGRADDVKVTAEAWKFLEPLAAAR